MSVQEKIENIEKQLSKKEEIVEKKLSKKEALKQYNATYYNKNKEKLISKLCEKVECNICGRTITMNNLKLHKRKPICKNTLEQKLRDEKIINDIKTNL